MIVKNEAHCIIETLQSVYKYINFYVICDTGSTDNTIDLIKSFFNDKGIDGKIYHDKWKDFGYNRTIAIKRCKGHCNYIWTIDADDLLIGNINLNSLSHDCYYLQYGKNLKYKRRQIFINNDSVQWSYTGKLHEQLTCNKKDYTSSIIIGDYYIMSRRLGNRNKDPNKYQNDIFILISELKHNPNSHL
jgi:glycosyltransferase involved in cell wall biosynthesis